MNNDHPICDFLSTIPPRTSMSSVIVDGFDESIDSFVSVNRALNVAYFLEGSSGIVVADCSKISAVVLSP